MAERNLMHKGEDFESASVDSKSTIDGLLSKLVKDGASWVRAELAVTKAETDSFLRRIALGVIAGLAAFVILIVAVTILFQSVVALLGVYLGDVVMAGVIVGLGLFVLCIVLVWAAWRMAKSGGLPASFISRLIFKSPPQKGWKG
jgi:Putative Actinobacterial Holin-X, holin superfamily III